MSRCMSEGRSLYRINDKNPGLGCHEVKSFAEADQWNEKGWGIFWTVNSFNGPRRKEKGAASKRGNATGLEQLRPSPRSRVVSPSGSLTLRGGRADGLGV